MPAWGVSHCCAVGLAVSVPVPVANGGVPALSRVAGRQAGTAEQGCLRLGSAHPPESEKPSCMAGIPPSSILTHPLTHIDPLGCTTCQTPAQIRWRVCRAPSALLAQPNLPTPEISHRTVVLGNILGRSSITWSQQRHMGRTESFTVFESAAFTLQANYWLNHI